MTDLRELVVCSLEPWDDVWRRNQFFVAGLLERNPDLRVLFVEPPLDLVHELRARRRPPRARVRVVSDRLWALRPLKPLPRSLGPWADRALRRELRRAARALGFERPLLWVNDSAYAPLLEETGWPSVYDVTYDWLLAPAARRELARLQRQEQRLLRVADEVVVCSEDLARSRGAAREVTLIPNGVDAEHFGRPRTRPADLPPARVAVYVGTLHEARIDVALVAALARALPELQLAFVGPDSLGEDSRERLRRLANVHLLGARRYEDVPGYLQHADVLIVPHRVSPFTESLDPIKAYECLAVGKPTVATPVAGFRDLPAPIVVAPREQFADAVRAALAEPPAKVASVGAVSWSERCREFEAALLRAAG